MVKSVKKKMGSKGNTVLNNAPEMNKKNIRIENEYLPSPSAKKRYSGTSERKKKKPKVKRELFPRR